MSRQGLEAVLIAEREPLLRFLRARGAGEAAEDVLQELWLRLANLDTGPVADPRSYLFRAANNGMHDRYRSAQRSRQRDADWLEVQGGTGEASDAPLPDRQLIARAMLDQAEAVLAAEGARVLQVFRLFRIEGVSQRQIGQDLGVSLSAVEKDLQKAYRALMAWRETLDVD
ncbi:RNA polymerase sigma factor [Blastomonas fulva]|uniref:RNA polymerase sigma factor n=1 Tax=Blastomonas fulva TaxID=1550728 RepID=UPI003F7276E1